MIAVPTPDLFRNHIDITRVPVSDHGSRLLVFRAKDKPALQVKLVKRLASYPERVVLEEIARGWSELVNGRGGFYIEDKGYAMAPHGSRVMVYIGDNEHDEEAFAEVLRRGGQAILVSARPRQSLAQSRLESPRRVREWLGRLAEGVAGG